MDRTPIASRVRDARDDAGLTQSALARAVGIARTAVARIESGERRMTAEEAVRFAAALRRPVTWLLEERVPAAPSLRAVRAKRRRIQQICARHGARRIRVFGSVARGDARPESDIDLLVDLAPGRTLFDLAGLQIELSELFGRPVDVGTTGMLKERIRDRVLREAVRLEG